MEIKHVQQDSEGCMAASIAMVTGKTLKEIQDMGIHSCSSQLEVDTVLVLHKILPIRHINPLIYPDKLYLVTVPSLNLPGGNHLIVIDTRTCNSSLAEGEMRLILLDPNEGRIRAKVYTEDKFQSYSELIEIHYCSFVG